VMEDIGMRPSGSFAHKGQIMLVYESLDKA